MPILALLAIIFGLWLLIHWLGIWSLVFFGSMLGTATAKAIRDYRVRAPERRAARLARIAELERELGIA